jgi:hypothetical protein
VEPGLSATLRQGTEECRRRLTLQNETEESKLKDKLADKLLYASCNIGTLVYARNYTMFVLELHCENDDLI